MAMLLLYFFCVFIFVLSAVEPRNITGDSCIDGKITYPAPLQSSVMYKFKISKTECDWDTLEDIFDEELAVLNEFFKQYSLNVIIRKVTIGEVPPVSIVKRHDHVEAKFAYELVSNVLPYSELQQWRRFGADLTYTDIAQWRFGTPCGIPFDTGSGGEKFVCEDMNTLILGELSMNYYCRRQGRTC